jgi:hypothetical protein
MHRNFSRKVCGLFGERNETKVEGLKWGENYREIHFLVTKVLSRYRGKKVIAVRFIVNPFSGQGL